MMSRRRLNFIVDLVAGVLFVMSMFAGDGGAFHIVVSMAFTAIVIAHLYLHRRWLIRQVMNRDHEPKRPPTRRTRANFYVDMVILIALTAASASGLALVVSPGEVALSQAHGLCSVVFILGAVLHIVLHWSWIASCVRAATRNRRGVSRRTEPHVTFDSRMVCEGLGGKDS